MGTFGNTSENEGLPGQTTTKLHTLYIVCTHICRFVRFRINAVYNCIKYLVVLR